MRRSPGAFFLPTGRAARLRRSLIASPSPVSGTVIAAIRANPARRLRVQPMQALEQPGRRLVQIPCLRELKHQPCPGQRRPERQQRLIRPPRRPRPPAPAKSAHSGSAACPATAMPHPASPIGVPRRNRPDRPPPAPPDSPRPGAAKPASAPERSITVDSTPTRHAPESITAAIRPSSPASTCAAVVGEIPPERLAEGAATGPPNAANNRVATGCAGTRTASVSSPAPASSATGQFSPARQHHGQRARPERLRQQPRPVIRLEHAQTPPQRSRNGRSAD